MIAKHCSVKKRQDIVSKHKNKKNSSDCSKELSKMLKNKY